MWQHTIVVVTVAASFPGSHTHISQLQFSLDAALLRLVVPGELVEDRTTASATHVAAGRYVQIVALARLRVAVVGSGTAQSGQSAQAQHSGIRAGPEPRAQQCSCKGKNLQSRKKKKRKQNHGNQHVSLDEGSLGHGRMVHLFCYGWSWVDFFRGVFWFVITMIYRIGVLE